MREEETAEGDGERGGGEEERALSLAAAFALLCSSSVICFSITPRYISAVSLSSSAARMPLRNCSSVAEGVLPASTCA
eukprot:342798-Rhodomonas_salina.1